MIVPENHELLTDAELLEAYAEMGFGPDAARAFVTVLRHLPADPARPVD